MSHSHNHSTLPTHWRAGLAVLTSFLIVSAGSIILRRLQAAQLAAPNAPILALEAAARLDPANDVYPIRIAQTLQDEGRDPLPAWRRALILNPRNDLALTQAAIAAELSGDLAGAERLFRQAAQTNQLWLARWSLANFYFRRGQYPLTLKWATLALQRAHGDRTALFRLCRDAGAAPASILTMIVPADADNLAAYIYFLAADARLDTAALESAAAGYLQAARRAAYPPEQTLPPVVGAVNTLIAAGEAHPALRLWRSLSDSAVLPYSAPTSERPLVNAGFAPPVPGGGFDWRVHQVPGIEAYPGVPGRGIKFVFSGRQPEAATLLQQVVYLRGGMTWALSHQSQTVHLTAAGAGLAWMLAPVSGGAAIPPVSAPPLVSDDWSRLSTSWAVPPGDSLYRLSLEIRRPSGQTRAEGEARFRDFDLAEMRP